MTFFQRPRLVHLFLQRFVPRAIKATHIAQLLCVFGVYEGALVFYEHQVTSCATIQFSRASSACHCAPYRHLCRRFPSPSSYYIAPPLSLPPCPFNSGSKYSNFTVLLVLIVLQDINTSSTSFLTLTICRSYYNLSPPITALSDMPFETMSSVVPWLHFLSRIRYFSSSQITKATLVPPLVSVAAYFPITSLLLTAHLRMNQFSRIPHKRHQLLPKIISSPLIDHPTRVRLVL